MGKKYNYRTLYRMRKFYQVFSNEKLTPLVSKMNWSHYLQVLSIKNIDEIVYYINICIKENLSKRDLQNKIKSKEYQRLDENTKNKLINKEEEKIEDFIKNPVLIKNSYAEEVSEKILKRLILEDIGNFLKELGNGFSYIDSEFKIKIGDRFNFIDLLLFNYIYNAFVVVELKVTEIKVEHIAQIKKYMNYIDKKVKSISQDNTIGIVICKRDNVFVMEYCSDERVYRTTYKCV